MSTEPTVVPTRRDALKATAGVAAAAGFGLSGLYAGESNTINIALVGCGGRGSGAAVNALSTKQGPVKLVALADVFKDRLEGFYNSVSKSKRHGEKVAVTKDTMFLGFDAYKKAIDCLSPGDVVILGTPPAFRWPQFSYAIEKGVNVFMEKPVTVDGGSTRRLLRLNEDAERRGLKVGVGLMCRHCNARRELFQRIRDGQIGDVMIVRAYRQHGPVATCFSYRKPDNVSEVAYQIQRFHSFLWASGGCYSDFLIHNIDECCWMKDAFPIRAKGAGGRHYRSDNRGREWVDQNFDSYSVEHDFADGTKMYLEGRTITGCHQEFATYVHGTRGSAIVSTNGHTPARPRIFRGQNFNNTEIVWQWDAPEPNPYQLEWDRLIEAIRQDRPHNEVRRGAEASLVTAMGRMAAHTGRIVTRDECLNNEHEFATNLDGLTMDGPAPVMPDANGRYPVPRPGQQTRREY
jgi:predicted dehydrogenase